MTVSDNYEKFVYFPPSTNNPSLGPSVKCSPSIVVVGANGSGKTRLGVWLETTSPEKNLIHRIPAQRTLRFPPQTSPIGMQSAVDAFQWGERPANWNEATWEANKFTHKLNIRYGNVDFNSVATAPVSDYDRLLTLLFSENYTQLLEFQKRYVEATSRIPPPETILERVKRVWESILPHRVIEYKSSEVLARATAENSQPYLASGMSDGERAVFYLVGQSLCAADNAIIVIDEPELHLHRSIQQKLWNTIEAERSDCQFIYITHDLAFAESRTDATKVWLRSSDGTTFEWIKIDENEAIPESVYLEILGSRRPVLFVEGEYNSIDHEIYQAAHTEFQVRPMGSCSSVLAATKAFRKITNFHHIQCFGAVDRDYLTDQQVAAYKRSHVFAPLVAEMENLFLLPDVLSAMANQLQAPEDAVHRVINMVIDEFSRQKAAHALELTKRDIGLCLGRFNGGSELEKLRDEFATHVAAIDIQSIFDENLLRTKELIAERAYEAILKEFNHKGLVGRATGIFGLTSPSYLDRARRILRQRDNVLIEAMRPYLPSFQ